MAACSFLFCPKFSHWQSLPTGCSVCLQAAAFAPTTHCQLSSSPPTQVSSSFNSGQYAAAGSYLGPNEQCGGGGGLCNTSTIGVPCGDHAWDGSFCPNTYSCQRQNSSVWLCLFNPNSTSVTSSDGSGSSPTPYDYGNGSAGSTGSASADPLMPSAVPQLPATSGSGATVAAAGLSLVQVVVLQGVALVAAVVGVGVLD